jgi:hypothetical protein
MKYKFLFPIFLTFAVAAFGQSLPEFKVNALKLDGRNKARESKMRQALTIFEKVMNDTAFQSELQTLVFQFDVEDDPHRNLSNRQIVEKIYAAKEHYKTHENNTADIYWVAKKRNFFVSAFAGCSVLGYGDEDGDEIFTYPCFLDNNDLPEIAGHIAHEWTHKLGFAQDFDNHPKRDETVSYAFGYLIRKHLKKYLQN